MKNTFFISYALWVVGAITLKIVGWVSWWVATSWLWLPLAIIITIGVALFGAALIGDRIKEKTKIPDSCEICLWGRTKDAVKGEKCFGEKIDESVTFGNICPHYRRFD